MRMYVFRGDIKKTSRDPGGVNDIYVIANSEESAASQITFATDVLLVRVCALSSHWR